MQMAGIFRVLLGVTTTALMGFIAFTLYASERWTLAAVALGLAAFRAYRLVLDVRRDREDDDEEPYVPPAID